MSPIKLLYKKLYIMQRGHKQSDNKFAKVPMQISLSFTVYFLKIISDFISNMFVYVKAIVYGHVL